MTTGQVQVIIFDFGGVLMRTADPRPRRELEQRLDLPVGGVDEVVFGSRTWEKAQSGTVTLDEFWRDLGRRLGLDSLALAEFRRDFWAGDRLDEELVGFIRGLREAGYRTLLLSNGPAAWFEDLVEMGVADLFDEVVFSGQEGVMKPDLAAFNLALQRGSVSPEEAVFIDDSRENVEAARGLGIRAHCFHGLAPLRLWLQELGLSVPPAQVDSVEDVRAIIFDWAGVIEGSPDCAYFAVWEERLGLGAGELPGILWNDLWRQVEMGMLSIADYLQYLAERLNLADAGAAGRFIEEFYDGDWLYPEMVAAVRALHGRYRLALLTNAYAEQDEWLRKMFDVDVYKDFDVYVNSARVGMRKPDPAIYELTLSELAVEAHQAIFLDDSLRNVDVARELGIHTVHVVDPALSLAELEALIGHSIDSSTVIV